MFGTRFWRFFDFEKLTSFDVQTIGGNWGPDTESISVLGLEWKKKKNNRRRKTYFDLLFGSDMKIFYANAKTVKCATTFVYCVCDENFILLGMIEINIAADK